MKTITHILALGVGTIYAFLLTPAGVAILHQYPKLSTIFSAIVTLLALYHNPNKPTTTGSSVMSNVGKAILVLIFLGSTPLHAQSVSNINTFSLTATPIALPGGGQTVAGVDTGMTLTITNNFDLREDNILAPASNFQGFFGGFNYRLPVLSAMLNNVSPNLSGSRFQFYFTGGVGVDRILDPAGIAATRQHYAFLAGVGVNYDITGSGRWTMGCEVTYAKLPGLANNTAIIKVGPSLHF